MNRKKFHQYYTTRITQEQIPEFSAIRPFLKEVKADTRGQLKTSLAFYSAFSSLVIMVLTASFLYTSAFPGKISARYQQSNFQPYAEKKISNIESYLSEIRTYKKGEN